MSSHEIVTLVVDGGFDGDGSPAKTLIHPSIDTAEIYINGRLPFEIQLALQAHELTQAEIILDRAEQQGFMNSFDPILRPAHEAGVKAGIILAKELGVEGEYLTLLSSYHEE